MKVKLNPNIKMVINIITAILLIATVVIGLVQNVELNELSEANDRLNADIKTQENIIDKLTYDNENLSNNIAQLGNANSKLQEEKQLLELESQNLLIEIEKLKEEISQIKKDNATSSHKDFKSYMSYEAITNKASKQWKLQLKATTNEDGIRCIDGIPLVAVGTGWGLKVGDTALVTCENGNSFKVIIGDIKSDVHTDAENKTTVSNGCRCEFIVDTPSLNPAVRRAGNVAKLDKYKGYVVNITKVD